MSATITNDDAQYALDLVKAICEEVGPGLPGTPQERARAGMIRKELESHLGAENVAVEEFTFAPHAFLNLYPAIFLIFALLLNLATAYVSSLALWLTSIAALVFSILCPLLFFGEFFLSHEMVDPFFKKSQSVNVVGAMRGPGAQNVKRLLILSGHHDSAMENTWLRLTKYGFFFIFPAWFFGMLTMLVMSGIQLAGLIASNPEVVRAGMLGWPLMVYPMAPAILFGLFAHRGKKNGGVVPGAADNLSACAIAVAMCRFLARNPACLPADTEIRFLSFGSEEAGLRGSRRYVSRHLDELKRLDTRLLNYETVVHPEIGILTSDVNGTVRNSPEIVESVVAAARRAAVPHKLSAASLGVGTDAAPFSRAGLKAITLLPFKTPQQMVAFYHQALDTPEVLTIEPIFNVLKLTLEWVRNGGE